MSRRQKIFIVIAAILIILGLFYWLFLRPGLTPQIATPQTNVNAAPPPVALPSGTTVTAVVPAASEEDKLKSDISRLAASFAERFGSYSNQGNFANLLDLKPMMTLKMQAWADNYIKQNQTGNASVYIGVTTKAISVSIKSLDDAEGAADIVVGTQRQGSSGSMANAPTINYQTLELLFIKVNGEWKVDQATWG
jgi:hypothetical protein